MLYFLTPRSRFSPMTKRCNPSCLPGMGFPLECCLLCRIGCQSPKGLVDFFLSFRSSRKLQATGSSCHRPPPRSSSQKSFFQAVVVRDRRGPFSSVGSFRHRFDVILPNLELVSLFIAPVVVAVLGTIQSTRERFWNTVLGPTLQKLEFNE